MGHRDYAAIQGAWIFAAGDDRLFLWLRRDDRHLFYFKRIYAWHLLCFYGSVDHGTGYHLHSNQTKKGFGAANRVANRVMSMYLMFSIVLVTLLVMFAPFLARILCPPTRAPRCRLLTQYLRLFSLTILFAAFQSNFSAVLNANDSYIPGKLYGVIVNPIIILCMMLFGAKSGFMHWSSVL